MKNIIKGIKQYYPVTDSSISNLIEKFQKKSLPKHSLLTSPGIIDNSVYFIEQGCARTFFPVDGREVTNWFSKEGDLTFSSNSLYHRTKGFEYIELLEDSLLYIISVSDLDNLYKTNIEIANWSRIIHQEVLLKMQTLRIDRLSLSAKERYDKFFSENPGLFNRVNLGHIASYLGMTQQYLSALRSDFRF